MADTVSRMIQTVKQRHFLRLKIQPISVIHHVPQFHIRCFGKRRLILIMKRENGIQPIPQPMN